MIKNLEKLENLEILDNLENLKKNKKLGKLRHRRSPQLGNHVAELLRQCLCRQGDAFRHVEDGRWLSLARHIIARAEEFAKQTVVVVMMSLLEVSRAMQTLVLDINCIMMHMQRRHHHHRQVARQQHKRYDVSQ